MAAPIKLHFAHANGFPASSYQQLFNALGSDFEILALEKFAHNPQYPVTLGWQNQVDELIAFLDQQQCESCYLVGHSFGAVVSYMTACRYPQRVKGLIMLDPPLITGITRWLVKGLRPTPLFDRFTPAKQTLKRCTQWREDTDMVDYFRQKTLFKDMHIQCIKDYVSAAISRTKQGYQLDFDHLIEANIFRTIPLDINQFYGELKVPAGLFTGENTQVCKPYLIAEFIKHNHLSHQVVSGGGHMFPLEQPTAVAGLIKHQISEWESNSPA